MGWEAKWNNCLYGNKTTNQPVISGLQEFLKQKGKLGQYTGLTNCGLGTKQEEVMGVLYKPRDIEEGTHFLSLGLEVPLDTSTAKSSAEYYEDNLTLA